MVQRRDGREPGTEDLIPNGDALGQTLLRELLWGVGKTQSPAPDSWSTPEPPGGLWYHSAPGTLGLQLCAVGMVMGWQQSNKNR